MNVHSNLVDVFGCSAAELSQVLVDLGEKSYRAKQIWKWIYRKNIHILDKMTDISQESRQKLKLHLLFPKLLSEKIQISKDGSIKFLLVLTDQNRLETVYIPEDDRGTICVSSQVGCAMGCQFCYTGTSALVRNLTASEIIQQILFVEEYLRVHNKVPSLTNIVFMGMGEPFNNYDNVAKTVSIITDPEGLTISRRRITISTSGIVPYIEKCAKELRVNLAVSLHAVNNDLRTKLMPINKKYPLEKLIKICKQYQRLAKSKRITFEYIMLKGINDKKEDATKLTELIHGIPCIVNLIPFNAWPGTMGRDPGEIYGDLAKEFGNSYYDRVEASASPEQKEVLLKLSANQITTKKLAGEKIQQVLVNAPGNGAAIGGLKVVTKNAWFAARPSGTENIYKIYAESFLDANHLNRVIDEAQEVVNAALGALATH